MASTDFHLVTNWRLDAPVERVWAILTAPETWPQWWASVRKVDVIEPGDADGIGAIRRLTWATALPYDLTFDMRTTRVEPMTIIEGRASGELDGTGRWTLTPEMDGCNVRYDWIVEVTKALDGQPRLHPQAGLHLEPQCGHGTRPAGHRRASRRWLNIARRLLRKTGTTAKKQPAG